MPGPNDARVVSQAAIEMIGGYEGFVAEPYNDPAGHATIGFGHLLHLGAVTPQDRAKYPHGLSREEGLALLAQDVEVKAKAVRGMVTVPLTQGQFDALVSFAFNLGAGKLKRSTLLTKVNAGDFAGAAAEFAKFNKAGDKVLPGLTKRRAAEAALFRGDGTPAPQPPRPGQAWPPGRTLKEGCNGPDVAELQRRLRIGADGAFGPKTKAAVVAFQRSKKLTADGICGPRTAAALS